MGRGGREDVGCPLAPPTAFTLGDGGMASPSLGVRVPLLDLAPGMAGRRRGAGEERTGTGLGPFVDADESEPGTFIILLVTAVEEHIGGRP
jgi:hypothetical protein